MKKEKDFEDMEKYIDKLELTTIYSDMLHYMTLLCNLKDDKKIDTILEFRVNEALETIDFDIMSGLFKYSDEEDIELLKFHYDKLITCKNGFKEIKNNFKKTKAMKDAINSIKKGDKK